MNLTSPTQVAIAGSKSVSTAVSATSRFAQDGFVGPVRVFNEEECRAIAAHLRHTKCPAPVEWHKGRAVTDRFLYDLAAHPGLLVLLTQLLGENVILWGVSVVERNPGTGHAWHTDIESSAPEGGFASVWIGIENTSRESSLRFIRRSHDFGTPIQQVVHEHGLRRGEASSEAVLGWAREYDPDAALVQPEVRDGEAMLFDGRIWHGSHSPSTERKRIALLLQYAIAEATVRIPDFSQREWPIPFLAAPLPPAIVVHGTGRPDVNRLVPPPESEPRPAISTWIRPLALPLPEDPQTGWRPYGIFRGPTGALEKMGCHVSVLSPGHCPHPPHIHPEEEVLIVLDGEAEIVLADDPESTNARIERLGPGSFSYYPSDQHHTIRNTTSTPITYLMFKWRAAASGAAEPLGASVFHHGTFAPPGDPRSAGSSPIVRIFEQATAQLCKLHAHLTTLQPGAGYDPHVDRYDVAILVLAGKVETLGEVVEPHGLIYYSAGTAHGMRNVGSTPARYLVFEFHGAGPGRIRLEPETPQSQPPRPAPAPEKKGRFISTRKFRRLLRNLAARLRAKV